GRRLGHTDVYEMTCAGEARRAYGRADGSEIDPLELGRFRGAGMRGADQVDDRIAGGDAVLKRFRPERVADNGLGAHREPVYGGFPYKRANQMAAADKQFDEFSAVV